EGPSRSASASPSRIGTTSQRLNEITLSINRWIDAITVTLAETMGSVRRDPGSDRASDADAAEAAVTHRIFGEVLLVIVLGKIEFGGVEYLGCDHAIAFGSERLFEGRLRGLCSVALLRRIDIDAGSILRTDVIALAHPLRRVVIFPERLQQLLVGDLLRIVDDKDDLVVPGPAGADLLIGRIGSLPGRVTNCSHIDGIAEFPELALSPPKAAHAKQGSC